MGEQPMTPEADGLPLLGQRVMVTRPESPGDPLAEQLRALGAEVILQPAICIADPPDWRPVDEALARLETFAWLVFSSANGVRYLLERWRQLDTSQETDGGLLSSVLRQRFSGVQLAAIGPGTAEELARYQLGTDRMPERFRADVLADTLCREARGVRFLLVRASRGREVLAEQLTAAGAEVEQVVVYSSTDVTAPDSKVSAMLAARQIDWVTVTSSAIARSLARLFGGDLRRSKLASISPLTSGALRELGYEPAVEAAEYTMAGIVAAITGGVQAVSPEAGRPPYER